MKRSELYALVWRIPLLRLGPLLGMSGTGLNKLCRRHDIPVPDRGYWLKRDTSRVPAPLPPQDGDEVIPRLRAVDGNGEPLEADEVEWVIPGVLQAAATPETPSVDVAGLRAALSKTEGRPVAKPRARPQPASRPSAGPPGMSSNEPPVKPPACAGQRETFVTQAKALTMELERAARVAHEHHRYRLTLKLLSAVAMRAVNEEPKDALVLLAWVGMMRRAINDPLEHLLDCLRNSPGADLALWSIAPKSGSTGVHPSPR